MSLARANRASAGRGGGWQSQFRVRRVPPRAPPAPRARSTPARCAAPSRERGGKRQAKTLRWWAHRTSPTAWRDIAAHEPSTDIGRERVRRRRGAACQHASARRKARSRNTRPSLCLFGSDGAVAGHEPMRANRAGAGRSSLARRRRRRAAALNRGFGSARPQPGAAVRQSASARRKKPESRIRTSGLG
jgi:hypothetical protein